MRWFRFQSEVIHDPKVLRLPVKMRWRWVELLCVANQQEQRGFLPPIEDIALTLRLSEKEVTAILTMLEGVGLLDITTEHVRPHNWDKWQPASDNAAERMANKRRTSSEHVQEDVEHVRTRSDQIRTDQIRTEQIRTEQIRTEENTEDASAPDNPFAFTYAAKYRERNPGRRPPPVEHAAALALEREFGADACLQVAADFNWEKHPNYLRPVLEERRNGRVQEIGNHARRGARAPAAVGITPGWDEFAAGQN